MTFFSNYFKKTSSEIRNKTFNGTHYYFYGIYILNMKTKLKKINIFGMLSII